MGHIENQLKQCRAEMRKTSGEKYSFLYAIQQALEWVLDPVSYASPVDTVLNNQIGTMDIPVDSKDCSAALHLPQS